MIHLRKSSISAYIFGILHKLVNYFEHSNMAIFESFKKLYTHGERERKGGRNRGRRKQGS